MWKFKVTRDLDLASLLEMQPAISGLSNAAPDFSKIGQGFHDLSRPRALQTDPRGREMLARAKRGLGGRQDEELAALLYQGCLMGMMALPQSVTNVLWKKMVPGHRLQLAKRAGRELERGHGPGLIRDVLQGLVAQSDQFVADPILICRAAVKTHFHFLAQTLLVLVLRMYRRHSEALQALDELEALPLSLSQRATCMGNRGFILFITNRMEESHEAYALAAQMSPESHFEFSVLVSELMQGNEQACLESAARLEAKLGHQNGMELQALDTLASQMKTPIWQATRADVARINAIKIKLNGIPALIADILSTIKVNSHSAALGGGCIKDESLDCGQQQGSASADDRGNSGPLRANSDLGAED